MKNCKNCTGILILPAKALVNNGGGGGGSSSSSSSSYADCRPFSISGTSTVIFDLPPNSYDCSQSIMNLGLQFNENLNNATGFLNVIYKSISDNGCANWGRWKLYGYYTGNHIDILPDGRQMYRSKLCLLKEGSYQGFTNQVLANFNYDFCDLKPGQFTRDTCDNRSSSSSSSMEVIHAIKCTASGFNPSSNSYSNEKFISGMYCALINAIPAQADFDYMKQALNKNRITKADVIDFLTATDAFQPRLRALDLYYTYGVTPPPLNDFLTTILPQVEANNALAIYARECGCCPSRVCTPQTLYGCTEGLVDLAADIFDSPEFFLRYPAGLGGEPSPQNMTKYFFLKWLVFQNSEWFSELYKRDPSITPWLSETVWPCLADLATEAAASPRGKAKAMAYMTRAMDSYYMTCGDVLFVDSSKYKYHLKAIAVNYLLRDVWINRRTDYTESKHNDYLFSLPGDNGTLDYGVLGANYRAYLNNTLIPRSDWGDHECCTTIPGGGSSSSSSSSSSSRSSSSSSSSSV